MHQIFSNFTQKRAVDIARDHKRVLVDFAHGLGDTVMFLPAFEDFRAALPSVQVDLLTHFGQDEVFGKKDAVYKDYDVVFTLPYDMAENSGLTKTEACCVRELGISPVEVKKKLNSSWYRTAHPELFKSDEQFQRDSPYVLLAFQSTALPDPCNCPLELAETLWREVESVGKIPVECHFQHCFANPRNVAYPFVGNSTTRKLPASVKLLSNVVKTSFAFVGVATGSTVVAMASNCDRTAFLERAYHRKDYFAEVGPSFDIATYKRGSLAAWLRQLER